MKKKAGAIVGVVAVGVIGYLAIPSPPKMQGWQWNHPTVTNEVFEIGKTVDFKTWTVVGYAAGTNRFYVPDDEPKAFFTILRTMARQNTNIFVIWAGYTNQYYSGLK